MNDFAEHPGGAGAPHRDLPRAPDALEHRLAELFQQRAATVTVASSFDLAAEGVATAGNGGTTGSAGRRMARRTRTQPGGRRRELGVLAAAAAMFVAVAGTIIVIQAGLPDAGHRTRAATQAPTHPTHPTQGRPTPTAEPSRPACLAAVPASWRQAIAAGRFPVDRGLNNVVSANAGSGDYLAVQGNQPGEHNSAIYLDVELALFHGSVGQRIYTPSVATDIPVADPTGAISTDWIAFALTRPQNLDSYQVLLYRRATGATITLATIGDQQAARNEGIIGAPVIAAGKVYWLDWTFNRPETTVLNSWDLARGTAAGSVPAAGGQQLIPYGSGVALARAVGSGTVVSNGVGEPLSAAQLAALSGGVRAGFDGAGKLSWLRQVGFSMGYSYLTVGRPGFTDDRMVPGYVGSGVAGFPLVAAEGLNSERAVLDLRSQSMVRLPDGVSLQAVVGDQVIFGTATSKSGAAGLSVVRLAHLPPVGC